MLVSEWLKLHPIHAGVVREDWGLDLLMQALLSNSRLHDLYVLGAEDKVIGHLSYKKLAKLALADHCDAHTRSELLERIAPGLASELMDVHFASARGDEQLSQILYRQLDHWVEDLPVLDEQGKLQGVINLSDILFAVMKAG